MMFCLEISNYLIISNLFLPQVLTHVYTKNNIFSIQLQKQMPVVSEKKERFDLWAGYGRIVLIFAKNHTIIMQILNTQKHDTYSDSKQEAT
jgi:uncharacterized membrane protein YagU involved in acid resistance